MGYSLSWLAVRGRSPQAIRDELAFRLTGVREEIPEAKYSAVEMPGGWYVIVANRREQVVATTDLRLLSAWGCELVTCYVEEHVMVSTAAGWHEGEILWMITHDAQESITHLDVQGEPPPDFAAIHEELFARQEPGTCDYIFHIPIETARSVTGFRHDQEIPGLTRPAFEVLEIDRQKKPPFLKPIEKK